jgi:hypothetical protein
MVLVVVQMAAVAAAAFFFFWYTFALKRLGACVEGGGETNNPSMQPQAVLLHASR